MNGINTTFHGNLGKDAEVVTIGQSSYFKFNVAVGYTKREQNQQGQSENVQKTMWVTVLYRYSDGLKPYMVKGTKVLVSGGLVAECRLYNGQAYQDLNVWANDVALLSVAQPQGAPQGGYQQQYAPQQQQYAPQGGYQQQPQYAPQPQPQYAPQGAPQGNAPFPPQNQGDGGALPF